MSGARSLVVVGEPPLVTLAAAIGAAQRGAASVRVVELSADRIQTSMLEFLAGERPDSTDVFAAIGMSALNFARFDLWAKLKLNGFRAATLVHDRATVDPTTELAENVLVAAGAVVDAGARIGTGTVVGAAASIGAGASVGAWTWIASGSVVGANAAVGGHVVIGVGSHLADRSEFPGPGEISVAGTWSGRVSPGTFISSELPGGARLMVPR